MKKNRLKIMSLVTATMLAMGSMTAYATENVSQTTLNDTTTSGTQTVDFEYNKPSQYTVYLPKVITIDGESKNGTYMVKAMGDISLMQKLNVVPVDEVTSSAGSVEVVLHDNSGQSVVKDNVNASVSQAKTQWNQNELAVKQNDAVVGTSTTGTISCDALSAGKWVGVLQFTISLETSTN